MPLESAASQSVCFLVRLSWGDSSVRRYATGEEEVQVDVGNGTETFNPETEIEIALPTNHSGVRDKPGEITAKGSLDPFKEIRRGFRHPKVTCRVWTYSFDTGETTLVYKGRLGKAKRAPDGRRGLVSAELTTIKSRLVRLRVSMPATKGCQNIFGGPVCGYDRSQDEQTGTISAVTGSTNTVETNLVSTPSEKYRRGEIVVDGMRLQIKATDGSGTFTLYAQPSPSLVGKSFSLLPGCLKTPTACRFWDRESQFNGFGIAMPKKNPSLNA